MTSRNHRVVSDPEFDPFKERAAPVARGRFAVLGARIDFESNSHELFRLANAAYGGLPAHRLSRNTPHLRVRLLQTPLGHASSRWQPAPIAMFHGAGLLGGATGSSNFVVVSPCERAALVAVSADMLRFPYHVRYELIEFAVFTLAARAQRLVPLHSACVGAGGRGVLLMGASGAGKTTVALHCLLGGLDFLTEDSAFVTADSLLATGVANFLHIRADSVKWLGRSREAAGIRRSPVIRRRSGVRKFEVDLRVPNFRLAKAPLKIRGVVFLSAQRAGGDPLLRRISKSELQKRLIATQAYAASQPQWPVFSKNIAALDAFELRRGRHPMEAAESLHALLGRL